MNLHPDPARPLKVTVMIKENQMPKIPKRFRTLWFFTGANMLNDYFWNDWKGEQTNVIFNSIDFFHATLRNVQSYVTNSPLLYSASVCSIDFPVFL